MNKNAIKKFAIDARNKLIDSVTDKAGMLGITKDACSEPSTKGADFEVYQTAAGTEVTLDKRQCEHRRKLVEQINERGFDAVVEEVAYTWFNRICAIRFMEVNDYMYPARVRVLSSEKAGKNEPDILTQAPDIDWNFTEEEREYIIDAKMNNKLDDLFRMLFIKQCNLLHEVLPGLFEETDDYTEMLLNISFTNEDDVVRMLVDGIDEADFNVSTLDENGNPTGQVEIIGWLYQYYNTELKDDTFAKLKKNIKISKERIPAATQLFTPDWIVRYMVENSVGRIWIEHLRANDSSVDEKATAERFGWKYYLPEAEQEEEVKVKLAEIRTTYKDLKPTDITCIDPCMGSGHILIAMFDILMDIYESSGYDKREAAFDIVEHNIHGLDIDKRAYQLAYFAVMMKGRGYNRRFLNNRDGMIPEPKVYAIEESNEINRNHLQFFGLSMKKKDREKAEQQIRYLLDTFVDAREYGSILNVKECGWELLEKFTSDLQVDGQISFESVGIEETQLQLGKLIKVAENLGKKYDAVVTNPPYMGASGMGSKLAKYVKDYYPDSKSDLFAVFIEKCGTMKKNNAFHAMITQHAWMFLSSFEKLRGKLLQRDMVNMAHLGARAFEEIGGEVVQTTSFVMRKSHVDEYRGTYCRLIEPTTQQGKEEMFLGGENRYTASQKSFEKIPGSPVAYWASEQILEGYRRGKLIDEVAEVKIGMGTGKNDIFVREWWEISYNLIDFSLTRVKDIEKSRARYFPYNKGGEFRKWYGNLQEVLWFDSAGQEYMNTMSGHRENGAHDWYCREGLTWSFISSSKFGIRFLPNGCLFDVAGSTLFSRIDNKYTLGFLASNVCFEILGILNPTLNFQAGNIKSLPIIFEREKEVDNYVDENIIISKSDWDSFETSWDFKTHPFLQMSKNSADADGSVVTRISDSFGLWKAYTDIAFEKLKSNEEELNRIFIDIYGLQDELTPEEDDKDITVRKADMGRDIRSFISYAVGCMFGRYSLDREGLVFAGGNIDDVYWKCQGVAPLDENSNPIGGGYAGISMGNFNYGYFRDNDDCSRATQLSFPVDFDNIIPITDEEYFSDDIVSRFIEFVKTVYGEETLEENLQFIADALGNKGNTSREVIRNYFLKDFYADHLKVYKKRPIYWLFDSGKQNGFKALIYMHRYDADTVGRVRTDYLHKAQKYVETAMQGAQYTLDNAASSSEKSKATKAITKYTKQLAEMKIYDEAIAHIANQRIEIDLDDGVKVNYAKFQGVEVAQEGKKALKVDLLAKI